MYSGTIVLKPAIAAFAGRNIQNQFGVFAANGTSDFSGLIASIILPSKGEDPGEERGRRQPFKGIMCQTDDDILFDLLTAARSNTSDGTTTTTLMLSADPRGERVVRREKE